MQADSRYQEVSTPDASTPCQEGTESPVTRQRDVLASHRPVTHTRDNANAEPAPDIEKLGRVANRVTAPTNPGEPTEPVDGDHLDEPVDRTPALLSDETTLPSALV